MRTVARGVGLVALAVGLAACDATESTSTEPTLYEGAKISVTGTTSLAVPGLDGRLVSVATREWATDGIVTRGLADAEKAKATQAPMPYLAIPDDHALATRGVAGKRQFLSDKDRSGNTQDLVFIKGANGPTKTIVHLENGKISQAYDFEWTRTRGGWLAKSFAVTLYKDGKVVARISSTNKKLAPGGPSMMLADDDECWYDIECDPWGGTGGGSGGGGGGGGGWGFYECSCTGQLQDYLAAAAALAAATQIAIDTGTITQPWVAIGLAAAATYVWILLMRYNDCVRNCQRYQADAGGSTGPPERSLLFMPTDRYLLRPA